MRFIFALFLLFKCLPFEFENEEEIVENVENLTDLKR